MNSLDRIQDKMDDKAWMVGLFVGWVSLTIFVLVAISMKA